MTKIWIDIPVTELSAYHLGVSIVPLVVTDGAPPARVENLHTTFEVFLASHQTQRRAATCEESGIYNICESKVLGLFTKKRGHFVA